MTNKPIVELIQAMNVIRKVFHIWVRGLRMTFCFYWQKTISYYVGNELNPLDVVIVDEIY